MEQKNRTYIAVDLKAYYASVECVDRGLDPLTTNLAVADSTRSEKTICLVVSPALKSYGMGGRARLFEVIQKAKSVNAERLRKAPDRIFIGLDLAVKLLTLSVSVVQIYYLLIVLTEIGPEHIQLNLRYEKYLTVGF